MRSRLDALLVLLVGAAAGQESLGGSVQQCAAFAAGRQPTVPWTYDDCVDVWTDFADSTREGAEFRFPLLNASVWRDTTAAELRRQGSPCLVMRESSGDGVGSNSMRFFASWIFAKQMGCDWITPVWGRPGSNGSFPAEYCHSLYHAHKVTVEKEGHRPAKVCSTVDWVSYFQFGVPSVSMPENGTVKIIYVRGIQSIARRIDETMQNVCRLDKNTGCVLLLAVYPP